MDVAQKETAVLRCKVRVGEVLHSKRADGTTESERVKLYAVTATTRENKQWSLWTPGATFDLYITNPDAFSKLSAGHEFYVDFIPAAPEPQA